MSVRSKLSSCHYNTPRTPASEVSQQRRGRKPDWDTYLTDPNKYKLTTEELIQKKQNLVSKNNIFAIFNPESTKIVNVKSKGRKLNTNKTSSLKSSNQQLISEDKSDPPNVDSKHLSSIDLIKTPSPKVFSVFPNTSETDREVSTPQDEIIRGTEEKESTGDLANYRRRLYCSPSPKPKPKPLKGSDAKHTNPEENLYKRDEQSPRSVSRGRSFQAKVYSPQPDSKSKQVPQSDDRNDPEFQEMTIQIKSLYDELKYFEQLSGRKSALDPEIEIEEMFDLSSNSSLKSIMKALVQLVSQTMSYMLKCEIEKNKQSEEIIRLSERMDKVMEIMYLRDGVSSKTSTPQSIISIPNGNLSSEKLFSSPSRDKITSNNNDISALSSNLQTPTSKITPNNDILQSNRRLVQSPHPQPTLTTTPQVGINRQISSNTITSSNGIETNQMTGTSSNDWLFAYANTYSNNADPNISPNPLTNAKNPSHAIPLNHPQKGSNFINHAVSPSGIAMRIDKSTNNSNHDESSYVDEDTIQVYQFLSKNGDYLRSYNDDHHESVILQHGSGMNQSGSKNTFNHQSVSDLKYSRFSVSSKDSSLDPSFLSTSGNNKSNEDINKNVVFDDLVRRLTYSSVGLAPETTLNHSNSSKIFNHPTNSQSSPGIDYDMMRVNPGANKRESIGLQEKDSMVHARNVPPTPTQPPRHPYSIRGSNQS